METGILARPYQKSNRRYLKPWVALFLFRLILSLSYYLVAHHPGVIFVAITPLCNWIQCCPSTSISPLTGDICLSLVAAVNARWQQRRRVVSDAAGACGRRCGASVSHPPTRGEVPIGAGSSAWRVRGSRGSVACDGDVARM